MTETHYVRSGDGHVAFQVLGTGSRDILVVNEMLMPMEALHENVFTSSFLSRLTAWGRVIVFDRRGVGLSDGAGRGSELQLGDWADDAVAVLDAVGSERAAVFSSGPSAGFIAMRLAADHPERVSSLIVYDAIARYRWAADYPWGLTTDAEELLAAQMTADWGTARLKDRRGRFAATADRHPGFIEWAVTWLRRGAGPTTHAAQATPLRTGDVRALLPALTCPTMVISHIDCQDGRYLTEHIAAARYVEVLDPCHLLFSDELDGVMAAMSEMLNGSPVEPARHCVLTTLLLTDVVDATASVTEVGDRRWGIEVDLHDEMVRRHIERFDGTEIKTIGDGFIALFDGPTRAVQCALAIRHEAGHRGVSVRAGVHTGEVEMRGGDVLGVNVHVAQRMCALAAGGQVLVSSNAVVLVGGSELRFDSIGDHQLKGLPGRWGVFEAAPSRRDAIVAGANPARTDELSPREREVLVAVGTGASNAQIAAALFVSEATVKAHVSHLFTKLSVVNRVQLALHAHRIDASSP